MRKIVHDADASNENGTAGGLLDEIVRDGARAMLAAALPAEVAAYIDAHAGERSNSLSPHKPAGVPQTPRISWPWSVPAPGSGRGALVERPDESGGDQLTRRSTSLDYFVGDEEHVRDMFN